MELTQQDWDIRLAVYRWMTSTGHAPTDQDIASELDLPQETIRQAFHRLNKAHALFLQPDTDEIRMAHPLSAIPTDYQVEVEGISLYANCAWDSLGIPAMLGKDARVTIRHPQTRETINCAIVRGELQAGEGVVHFALPFAEWYDDLIHT